MKKRKILLGLALAAAAVFSLSACGDDTEPTTPGTVDDGGSEQGGGGQVTPAKKNFTVNFYSNGGTAVASQTVEEGKKATKPTDPTRTGSVNTYTFAGWYTDVALTQAFSFDTAPTGDVTLYAKWTSTLVEATKITMNGTEYATVKAALAAIPTSGDTSTYTIILPKGTYEEDGLSYNGSATVKIVGATDAKYGADVVIKGHGSDMSAEKTRSLLAIQGTGNIILENLTLENTWTRTMAGGNNAQAEVLGTDTKGNTVAYNCSFKSNQDTLRTAGKAWFYGCYIEGDVDFLWMEQAGSVALYEKCEIVSVFDSTASSHGTYVAAPRMAKSAKVGKGLVVYNSTIAETAEAKENGQTTYLARNPWSGQTDYYNQVAYINTTADCIESQIWYNNPTATEFEKTAIGFKMDQATATSIGYAGNNDILSETDKANEYGGREAIINRVFNTGKIKFEKDGANYWDVNALIVENGYAVDLDTSSASVEGEAAAEPTTYKFDGSQDLAALTMEGFAAHSSGSYVGGNGATISIPVSGKCYVEVYGFYSGTVEAAATTQGTQVMFFNNGSTSTEVENDYIVYDAATTSVVLTSKGTTYITKVVVTPDNSTEYSAVTDITISASTKNYCVGVPLTLSAKVNPGTATNKTIKWSTSDENIATIDEYTGKVTFLTAGEVTFTASALDGSTKTASITLNPIEAKWVVAEWYTTDNDLDVEAGVEDPDTHVVTGAATEIGVFDKGGSTNKDLKINNVTQQYTFTNVKGESITTSKGLKLNSAGSLSFSTTKGNATLTLVTVKGINQFATPKVSDGTVNAALIGEPVENADGTVTYTYSIDHAGAWKISRGDETKECNPILYAKVEYDLTISKNTFVTYKGGTYHAKNETAVKLNHNEGDILLTENKLTFDNFTYTGTKNNNANNWLKINSGATIEFTAKEACTLFLYFYQGKNNVTVKLDDTEIASATASAIESQAYKYVIPAGGKVTITSTADNTYLGALEVSFETEAPVITPVSDTFDEDSTIDFSSSAALAASLDNSKITYAAGFTYNDHTDSIQLQSETSSFSFKVKAGAVVTVTSFGSGYGYLLIDGESNNSEVTFTKTYVADATVTISAENSEATGGWSKSYLKKIEITYPVSDTFEADSIIDFSSTDALAASLQNSKITYAEGFTYNDHTDSIQLQSATSSFSFKVKAGATVTVTSFGSGYGYLLIDGVSNNSEVTYTKTYDADATVTIAAENSEATGGWSKSYLKKIEITYSAE